MAHATLTRHEGDAVDRVVNSAQPSHAKGKSALSTGATERVNTAQASATGQGAPSGVSHGALSDSLTLRFERGDAVEIAHALIAELSAESIDHADAVVYDRGSFYVYDPGRGIYTERTQSELFQCVSRYAGSIVGPKDKPLSLSDRDIRGAIHAASQLVYRKDFFDSAPRGVVFSNGFVTVREGSVITLPHSPEHRAAHAIACEYAGAPTDDDIDLWLRTMREVFRRPIEDEKGNLTGIDELDTDKCMDLFQEFAGAALMGYATSYAACLVLQGPGNDGKSTLLHVLRALFPASAVSSIPPQSWSRGFLLAGLAGKRLNVVSELPSQDLMDSERFKAVVSGDALTAERKHQDPFTTAFEADPDAVFGYFKAQRKTYLSHTQAAALREQAKRTAWRLLWDWTAVQLSLIEMRQADLLQVFLPYIIIGESTFYKQLTTAKHQMLGYNPPAEQPAANEQDS
jgi:hypothetical protein